MICALTAGFQARGDILQWNPAGSSAAFTGNNWYDVDTGGQGFGPGGASTYNTLQFVGAGQNSKDAPIDMSVGASTSFTTLVFDDEFNSTNSTTISNGTVTDYIFHIGNAGSITDHATGGSIIFDRTGSGSFAFNLYGADTIEIAAGARMTFTSSVVLNDETSGRVGGIDKRGGGILILAGVNTYTAGTTVSEGTLVIANSSGSATGTGAVTVNTGGTLTGMGYISSGANQISVNGVLSPGSAAAAGNAGTIHLASSAGVGALTLSSTSTLMFDLGSSADLVALTSTGLTLGGGTLALNLGAGFDYGDTYTLFSGVSSETGSFGSVTGYDSAMYAAVFALEGSNYNLSFTPVPEPSTWAAAILALAVTAWTQRRRFAGIQKAGIACVRFGSNSSGREIFY